MPSNVDHGEERRPLSFPGSHKQSPRKRQGAQCIISHFQTRNVGGSVAGLPWGHKAPPPSTGLLLKAIVLPSATIFGHLGEKLSNEFLQLSQDQLVPHSTEPTRRTTGSILLGDRLAETFGQVQSDHEQIQARNRSKKVSCHQRRD